MWYRMGVGLGARGILSLCFFYPFVLVRCMVFSGHYDLRILDRRNKTRLSS